MVTSLFRQTLDPSGRYPFRVWDDYQFRRKGIRGSGGGPPVPVGPPVITASPVNIVLPVIDDLTPVVGSPLGVSPGTWTGSPTIVYTYEWYERTAVVVLPTPPANTGAPGISGNPWIGSTLHAGQGVWSGTTPITYGYAWKYTGGAPVPGAGTTANYVVQPGDLGMAIYCEVTGTNSVGSASATTLARGPITEPPPAEALTDELGETLTDELGEDLVTYA